MKSFDLRLHSNPSLCSNSKYHAHFSPINLVFLSLSLPITSLNSRFFKACCPTWQKRERGEQTVRQTEREKKREGRKRTRKGLIVQFNYQPWLVSALVGNYTTQLQETAPLHSIRVGTEGYAAACFLSLSYNPSLVSCLTLFLFFFAFLNTFFLSFFSTLPILLLNFV